MAKLSSKEKLKEDFRNKLLKYIELFNSAAATIGDD
jgi:hypothetical protein